MATVVLPDGSGQMVKCTRDDENAVVGGVFEFNDGGRYVGLWEDGKAHKHGVCTGIHAKGVYSGSYCYGFEVSGTFVWPDGRVYQGQWQNGRRHGMGVEIGSNWIYKGEWSNGAKGRYGVKFSTCSEARYSGTWANSLQDGSGCEHYADGGYYKGQWSKGQRYGFGVRKSAPFGTASFSKPNALGGGPNRDDHTAERDRKHQGRGGFVLVSRSDGVTRRRRGSLVERPSLRGVFKMRRQRSTGDIQTGRTSASVAPSGASSAVSSVSGHDAEDASNTSFIVEDEFLDPSVTETYQGDWKGDKRCGFGVAERSDGLKYEGEWYNNTKYGYGITTLKDGRVEAGKYKNNILVTSNRKKHLFLVRSAKFRERIEASTKQAKNNSLLAIQKEDMSETRSRAAADRAEAADGVAEQAKIDDAIAKRIAKETDLGDTEYDEPASTSTDRRHDTYLSSSASDSILKQASSSPYGDTTLQELSLNNGPFRSRPPCPLGGLSGFEPPADPGGRRFSNTSENSIHYQSMGSSTLERGRSNHRHSSERRTRPLVNQDTGPIRLPSNVMNDRFEHYNQPPSRSGSRPPSRATSKDRSVDRFGSRGTTPVPQEIFNSRTRISSQKQQIAPDCTPDSGVHDVMSKSESEQAEPLTGNGMAGGGFQVPYYVPSTEQEAKSRIKQQACGQYIPQPAPTGGMGCVKRTESLYINPLVRQQKQQPPQPPPPAKAPPSGTTLRRKKSLPEARPPASAAVMPREHVAALSSAQREAVRRSAEERERYRANPLLYLRDPAVLAWLTAYCIPFIAVVFNVSLILTLFIFLSS